MGKIEWKDIDSTIVMESPLWSHIKEIHKYANRLVKQQTDLSFDFRIEVTQIVKIDTDSKELICWVRLKWFQVDKPNHTFTLLTLRSNIDLVYPIMVELGFIEETIVQVDSRYTYPMCHSYDEFLRILIKLDFGLVRLSTSVKDYNEFARKGSLNIKTNRLVENSSKKGYKHWTDQENSIFIEIIEEYRKSILEKSDSDIKKITQDFAHRIKQKNEILHDRSERAIYEHLAYFDDLLNGVGEPNNYAKKDSHYFKGKVNNSLVSNPARIWRKKK